MKKLLVSTVPALLTGVMCLLSGCRNYQMGFVSHPEIETIAVGAFENKTDRPVLGALMKGQVATAVTTNGSLKLVSAGSADVLVQGKVVGVRSKRIASIKGDTDELSDYQTEYRGAMYRLYLDISFELVSPKLDGKVVLPAMTVTGEGTYANAPDMSTARHEAAVQAAADAARQIVAAVTEAW